MTSLSYWRIALPCPLRRLFTYSCPESEPLDVGDWVNVSFGSRQVVGLVLERSFEAETEYEIKPVSEVLATRPRLPEDLVQLVLWSARYYHAPAWEVITTFLPTRALKGEMPEAQKLWQAISAEEQNLNPRAPRQKQLFKWLSTQSAPQKMADISKAGFSAALVRQLENSGAIQSVAGEAMRQALVKDVDLHKATLDQARVIQSVRDAAKGVFLLEGVTGSGKTLVYQHLALEQLKQGRQVLVLVPEIGLVPQMLAEFKALVDKPLTYHSGMTDLERLEVWQACLQGRGQLLIGTRSAVFLPFRSLGLILVDEEHDQSYKQQENPRYQARDIAVLRAKQLGVPVLLGSATPSLESLYNVSQSNFKKLLLKKRIAQGQLPDWRILEGLGTADMAGLLTDSLQTIKAHLQQGNQVLVFINRRGYAPCLRCSQCGWQALCPECDSGLTYHKSSNELRCHRCDLRSPFPRSCHQCGSRQLGFIGQGTERIALRLAELFPQIPLIRIDRDATRGKEAMQRKLDEIHTSGPAILVGTQMLAKGHHFPKLSLVVILDVDYALISSDFRATEHLMQLLIQVAGRAGREEAGAEVLLQTEFAGHPLLKNLVQNDYPGFADQLLQKREEWSLPPFAYMAILRTESEDPLLAQNRLVDLVRFAEQAGLQGAEIIGPLPSPIEKRSGRYRFQIHISATTRSALHRLLSLLVGYMEKGRNHKKLRWHLDVDPATLD